MSSPFIPDDQLDAEKRAYAEALRSYRAQNPFDKEAPFKAAHLLWPEAAGKLPVALWAVYSQRWHEDETVVSYIDELDEEARQEAKERDDEQNAYYETEEFKKELKRKGAKAMLQILENPQVDAKDRIAAFDRLSKSYNLDEKPPKEEAPVVPWLGVISMPVFEVSPAEFERKALEQQKKLMGELIELDATYVQHAH